MNDKDKKRQIVKSMEDEDDGGVRIGADMEEVEPPSGPPVEIHIPAHKPLLARALPYLETYSRHGRGSRCPECGQVFGHNEKCKLAALIAEIEAVTK